MKMCFTPFEPLEQRRLLSAIGIGGAGGDTAYDVATDRAGNMHIVGNFAGTVDFDPGAGVANLSGGGSFVARYNVDGSLAWARRLATKAVPKVAVDRAGNVYVCGSFSGTQDFDPRGGVVKLTSAGGTDGFVLKLNSNGNFVYVRQFGGTNDDEATALAVDLDGNVVVGGQFVDRGDFDPGKGQLIIKSNGGVDGYLVYLDAAGNLKTAGSFGSVRYDSVTDVALDDSGNVLATGSYYGTVDFDPDSKVTTVNNALTTDGYVFKWTSSRQFVWVAGLGGVDNDHGIAVTVDRDGNVYSTGTFIGQGDFNPSRTGTFNLDGGANGSIYVSKLNPDGTFNYAKVLPGFRAAGIAVDKGHNVYTVGSFSGTDDFNPGAGTNNLTADGNDIFMSKLDASGNYAFARNFGEFAGNAVLARSGDVLVVGAFTGTADFDPGAGTSNLVSNGELDAFLASYDSNGNLASTFA